MVFTQLNLHCFSHCELCKGKCIDDQNDDNIDEPRDILKQRADNDNKVYSFSLEHRNSALYNSAPNQCSSLKKCTFSNIH